MKLILIAVTGSLVMMLSSACSPIRALNIASGAQGARAHADLPYGEHKRQTLDIYQTSGPATGCLVVFVYGGSWETGDKSEYGFVGAALARSGHTVVIPNYRLYPEVAYPQFVEDVALSLTEPHVRELAATRPLVVMGHSAGALIAGLVSYDPNYLAAVGLSKNVVDAYIAVAGPHDYFLPTDKPRWNRIFGSDKAKQREALTINHIQPTNPPTLILHGADDTVVTPKSATSLEASLQAAGVPAVRKLYKDVGHKTIIAAMSRGLGFLAPTLSDINQFLDPLCTPKEAEGRPKEAL